MTNRTLLNTLPEGRCVVGDDDELSLALPQCLERLFVAEHILAGLNDQTEARVDALYGLLLQGQTTG